MNDGGDMDEDADGDVDIEWPHDTSSGDFLILVLSFDYWYIAPL